MPGYSFNVNRLNKRQLTLAVIGWVALLVIGTIFVAWGFGPETEEVAPTPTEMAGPLPLLTPTGVSHAVPTAQSNPAAEEESFGYGVAAHALLLPDYTATQVKNLGLGWIKQQVRWSDFVAFPEAYDAVVDEANRNGLRVMLSVVDSPEWTRSYFDANPEGAPPDDLNQFAQFLDELVVRYQGRIHAIEVWNEENLDREWDNAEGVNPDRYVEMLRLAYQTIKSRDPNIIVISGALSPTGVNGVDPNNPNRLTSMDDFVYFDRMVDAGFLDYCDCVGAHHNGINIPPWVDCDGSYQDDSATFRGYWDPPQPPHHSWCFKTTLEGYHERIVAAGYDTPLCVTEFGWGSSEDMDGYPPAFGFVQDNTLQEQAEYDVRAFQLMREWGWVRLAFLWNLDYANKGPRTTDDPNAPYSLVTFDGVARPAFDAIGAMDKP